MGKIKDFEIYERALKEARYIVETGCTIREACKVTKVSKSTVHKDVTEVLRKNNNPLRFQVDEVLWKNWNEKHIRGGEATREKYRILAMNTPIKK